MTKSKSNKKVIPKTFKEKVAVSFKNHGLKIPTTDEEVEIFEKVYGTTDFDLPEELGDSNSILEWGDEQYLAQSVLSNAANEKVVAKKMPKKKEKVIALKQEPAKSKSFSAKPVDLHAGIIAKIINAHDQSDKHRDKLGHVKVEKVSHLVEYHLDIDLGRTPRKLAAGPADFTHLKKVEHRAKMKNWFISVQSPGDIGYSYRKGRSFSYLLSDINRHLKTFNDEVNKLIELFLPMNKEQAEVVVTVYAAWNNLLLDNKTISDEAVIREAREDWTKEKLKIEREKFLKSLQWLRTKNIIPKGYGQKVI
ncbi:MAG TPA: hypothetical protein VI461_15195 [Chitinophagaceae bacterium]|nr:hypothetical protein [Chitinophagaceae bacterium]